MTRERKIGEKYVDQYMKIVIGKNWAL